MTDRFNTNPHRAIPNADGSYTLTFNGDDGAANPLDVAKNWNAIRRCYLPVTAEGVVGFGEDFVGNHPILPLT